VEEAAVQMQPCIEPAALPDFRLFAVVDAELVEQVENLGGTVEMLSPDQDRRLLDFLSRESADHPLPRSMVNLLRRIFPAGMSD
jgi:hypothetical protein